MDAVGAQPLSTLQRTYLDVLLAQVNADPRILGVWLEGSYGRGDADRYSDLDLHLLLVAAEIDAFKAGLEHWLGRVRPLALFRWLFDTAVVTALTEDGLRLDVVPHAGATMSLDPQQARVLFQRGTPFSWDRSTPPVDPAASARTLRGLMDEFWRCISLTPSVLGRKEFIVSVAGLSIEVSILVDMVRLGNDGARTGGAKHLNAGLPDALQQRLEALLAISVLDEHHLADAHLQLAALMSEYGRRIAVQHGVAYPETLERVVRTSVQHALAELGLPPLHERALDEA